MGSGTGFSICKVGIDGNVKPIADNVYDLGVTGLTFRNLKVGTDAAVGGDLTVTGEIVKTGLTASNPVFTDASGNFSSAGTLGVVNLLTNTGFGVWSNSALAQGTTGEQSDYEVGTAIYDEDGETADNKADWTGSEGCAVTRISDAGNGAGSSDYYYRVTRDNPGDGDQDITMVPGVLVVGKTYKFSVQILDGDDAYSTSCTMSVRNNADDADIEVTALAAAAAWADYSVIWVATETNNKIRMDFDIDAADEYMHIDDVKVIEVAPACVAADALGPDGWEKTSTLDVRREHDGTLTVDGEFYSVRTKKGANGAEYLWWGADIHDTLRHYTKFWGRTVTLGAWIYSTTATDNAKLAVYSGSTPAWTASTTHAAAGAWEWQELTVDIAASSADVRFGFLLDGDTGDVAHFSQPILVFGSYIGSGNYTPPQNGVIPLEATATLVGFTATSKTAAETIDLESHSNLKIPKGAKAVKCRLMGNCGNTDKFAGLWSESGGAEGPIIEDTVVASKNHSVTDWCPCSGAGTIYFNRDDTFTTTIVVSAVEER